MIGTNVIVIPAKSQMSQQVKRQLRVAAYCRVSTDDEEQLTSYEAQRTFYTDKIMENPDWTMAGIFADEGITGTSARKRPEFLRMIRQCKQRKIDLILTKSISRFARNTVDCLTYVRLLKEHGIAVIFEEQNINTLESDSEMLITLLGAFAQAESESISANVRWGIRQAMREGKANISYKYLYAYEKGEDGRPRIILEQAEVVRDIYKRFLAGASLRQIKEWLESEGIPNVAGKEEWTISAIRGILTSEKYCGDVLPQKTFISDYIRKKAVKNTGQLPKYLIQYHHPAIVEQKVYDAVQAELARRKAAKSPTKAAPPALPPMPASTPFWSGWSAGSVGPSTAFSLLHTSHFLRLTELLIFGLKAPVIAVPQTDIEDLLRYPNVPLLKPFSPTIRCLPGDVLFQGVHLLGGKASQQLAFRHPS